MLSTHDKKTPIWFLFRSKPAAQPVWARTQPYEPVRHPARGKMKYRARGTTAAMRHLAPPSEVVYDHQATWQARTAAAAGSRKRENRKVAICAGMALTGLVVFSSSYTSVTKALVPMPVSRLSADIAANTPNLTAGTFSSGTPVRPSNLDQMPNVQLPGAPIALAVIEQVSQAPSAPLMSAPKPRIMERAPRVPMVQPVLMSPGVATLHATEPNIAQPLAIAAPRQDNAFICQDCALAFPQFGQVIFDVQAADTEAAFVQELMQALTQYQSSLRASAIPVTRNQIRFYQAQDAQAAAELATRYNADLVDLTWFAPGVQSAKIDILLSTKGTVSASADSR